MWCGLECRKSQRYATIPYCILIIVIILIVLKKMLFSRSLKLRNTKDVDDYESVCVEYERPWYSDTQEQQVSF